MKKLYLLFSFLFLILCFVCIGFTPVFGQTTGIRPVNRKLEQFGQDKFGMFIHWGPYAQLGGTYKGQKQGGNAEWIMLSGHIPSSEYEEVCKNWNPSKFNAEEWVNLAKEAGMKYLVFTTKHHDGFCMFKSKFTDYNLVDYTPFGRDVTKELSEACRKNNIKLGLYYSLADWHHPEFPVQYSMGPNFHGNPNPNADISKYADYQLAQIRELMSNYGPVSVAWFDGGGSYKNVDRYQLIKGDSMVSLIRSLQPNCLINDRIGGGKGDYGTPEQSIPGTIQQQAFETCMTMNDTWGFRSYDHNWKSTKDLLLKLVDIVHKGGNFLLNVGPNGTGKIPKESVIRLKEMGRWLSIYGEAVYGTNNSLFEAFTWGRSSTKLLPDGNSAIYLFIEEWPFDGKLEINGIQNFVSSVHLLSPEGEMQLKSNNAKNILRISLPKAAPDRFISVVRINLKGLPEVNSTLNIQETKDTNQAK